MASPQADNGGGEPAADNQAATFQSDSIDREPSGPLENVATVPVVPDAPSIGDAQESSRQKSEESPPNMAGIPKEVVADGSDDRSAETVTQETSLNHTAQATESTPALNDNNMAEASRSTVLPAPSDDDMAEASRNTDTQEAVPELMKPRTITVTKKFFTTPMERAVKAAENQRRLEEASDLFRQSLVSKATASAPVKINEPAIPSSADHDTELIEVKGFSEPIVIDDTDEEDQASVHFRNFKKRFERKKKQNLISQDDEIEFRRLAQAEYARERVKHRRQVYQREENMKQEDCDDSLFLPGDEDFRQINVPITIDNDETVDTLQGPPKKRRKPNVANKIPAKSLAEGLEAGWEVSKTKRERQGSKKNTKSKAPVKESRARVSKKSAKGDKKNGANAGAKRKGHTMLNLDSLIDNDVIGAAQANQTKGDLPTFKSKKKAEALTELIASIPQEHQKLANVDKRALEKATRAFTGHGSMKADGDSNWRLKGMRSSLKAFQVMGVAFMRDRENSGSRPHGGLDADVMGLGKTVKMIANILDGKPTDGTNNTTLIVCPSGLCFQWMKEIQKHAEEEALGPAMIYRSGRSNNCYSNPIAALAYCSVIITTYSEVTKSYPQFEQPKHLVTEEHQREWWEKRFNEKRGLLHKINFRRVVLDEAQMIKNRTSKVSLACRSLNGKYRWALTGTPIQNTVEEFFPYFSFLKVEHTGSYATFKTNYCKKGSEVGVQRLRAILNKIMIRRTHEDEMFGAPLAKLPGISAETITVEFHPVERAIYKIVRNRFIAKIRMYAKAGPLNQNYRTILVLYLRLRQLVGHILLIQKTIKELLEAEDVEKLWRLTEMEVRPDNGNRNILSQLKSMLSNTKGTKAGQSQEKTPQTANSEAESSQPDQPASENLGGNFGLSFKFRGILRNLHESGKWAEINSRSVCHKCGDPPQNPHVTSCMHIYCKECLESMLYAAAEQDQNYATCLECDTRFSGTEPCQGFEQASFSFESEPSGRRNRRGRSDAQSADEDVDWVTLSTSTLPSAKTLAIKAQCLRWQEEDPEAKIVIFTQFRGMIKILQRMCWEEQWGCRAFHGGMNTEARDQVVQTFQDDPDIKILIASLKAGGVGLNLMMASKVIIVDLWWNESVETQAFCRCYRIGQIRPVDIRRFVVKDTIDDDILAMQQRKTKEIDAALEKPLSAHKLSIKDLIHLFGPTGLDEDGNLIGDPEDEPFIFVEDNSGNEDRSDGELPKVAPARPADWKSSDTHFRA